MKRVKFVPLHNETVDTRRLRTPITDAFKKIASFNAPIVKIDLLRKRLKEKKI